MDFKDKKLPCRECGNEFLFTAGEQAFFRQKGLVNEPGRCPECRIRRRQSAVNAGATPENAPEQIPIPVLQPVVGMPITSHVREVTIIQCAECGIETTVPFRPRLARPVYCSSCFNRQRTMQAVAVTAGSIPDDQPISEE
jgi:CxxC-x17-CxxC domain-containing protein